MAKRKLSFLFSPRPSPVACAPIGLRAPSDAKTSGNLRRSPLSRYTSNFTSVLTLDLHPREMPDGHSTAQPQPFPPPTCRMSVDAYSNAEFLSPDLWHSMTVDVSTGTMCVGKREMLRATLRSIRAAPSWSPRRTIFFTCSRAGTSGVARQYFGARRYLVKFFTESVGGSASCSRCSAPYRASGLSCCCAPAAWTLSYACSRLSRAPRGCLTHLLHACCRLLPCGAASVGASVAPPRSVLSSFIALRRHRESRPSHQDVAVQQHEAPTKGLRHVRPLVFQLTDRLEQDPVRHLFLSA